ncbi:MAG TPA: class II aldolase/adducin family protein [Rariglobus sp.]|jgi:L-fuculose-phosphate aldolase|nr:class II aldolase/adducin family protein [Rariglobus sp.]
MDSTCWLHPRDELVATMDRIYRYHMTTTSGGNLSILDPDGSIWITPSRVDKGSLRPTDVVRVAADGTKDGLHPPSSEFPFHREIYRRRPDIKAIVHAHPGALVAFSIVRRLPETRVQTHAHSLCGKIAYAAYACPGSQELGDKIAQAFSEGADCVMLENHGVVIGGRDLAEAFQRFETLEFVAQTVIRASALGELKTLAPDSLAGQAVPDFAELAAAVPTNREKELRTQVCEFAHRAYRQRLMISTAGSISARLDEKEFVITPRRRDRLDLKPVSLVRATLGAAEAGKRASRTSRLHGLIYAANPEVGVIINAQPMCASAFCMTAAEFSSRTIPESYLVLGDAPKVPFACVVKDAEALAARMSLKKCPVLLIENEGALIVGRTLLEAFDRLEVLEATAEALQLSRPLGPLVPMPAEALSELRKAFGLE